MPKHHCLSKDAGDKLIELLGLDPSVDPDDKEKANRAINRVQEVLGHYAQILEHADSQTGAKPRGRPKKAALQHVTGELRRTFRQYYGEVDNTRKKRGAISNLSPAENDEREFIDCALTDAEISHPSWKKLGRSYHKQGTPLADRNKVIEKIVAEAERRAKNSPETGICTRIRRFLEYFRAS